MTLWNRLQSALLRRSEFAANVAKVSAGSISKTAISLLALPIVTRIYAAEDFGILQIFVSVVSIFVAIGALKYEMAIVLPEDPEESNQVAVLCVGVAAGLSTALLLGVVLFGDSLLGFFNASKLGDFALLIPLGGFLGMLFLISRYGLIARKRFGTYARSDVIQVAGTQALSISYGLMRPEFIGLIGSRLVGYCIGIGMALRDAPIRFASVTVGQLRAVAVKYRKFPMVNTIGVLANNLGIELPVFLLAKFFGADVVGFYMLTQRLLSQPMVLFGQAVQGVFLKSASDAHNRSARELHTLFLSTVRNLALMGLAPAAFVLLLAPPVVELLLGPEWREVGVFMQILMLAKYLELIMAPTSTAFSIVNRQEIAVVLMIAGAIARFGAMVSFASSPRTALAALSVTSAIFSVVYIAATWGVLRRLAADEEPAPTSP